MYSFKHLLTPVFLSISLLVFVPTSTSAQKVTAPTNIPSEWSKPYPPFRIAGNLYYVGTYDLACYLIVTPKGNILINTGLAASAKMIKSNVETLGFKFADTKILLTTQAHYDHMAAMAEIKRWTRAKLMVDKADVGVAEDGGSSDYALGGNGMTFSPVKVDRKLSDRDTIALGGTELMMLHHPGHTKGSSSYLFKVKDANKAYTVLIANMPTIVTDKALSEVPDYPGLIKDYTYTLNAMKNIKFDIWLSSHASQFGLHEKHKPGDSYNPTAFKDQKGYVQSVEDLQSEFKKRLTAK